MQSIKRHTTEKLYQAIQIEHEKLLSIQEHGVQKYSDIWILRELAHKFFKSPSTIEKIVYKRY